jgi:hypothetical protein
MRENRILGVQIRWLNQIARGIGLVSHHADPAGLGPVPVGLQDVQEAWLGSISQGSADRVWEAVE